jgi:hypothetical protein
MSGGVDGDGKTGDHPAAWSIALRMSNQRHPGEEGRHQSDGDEQNAARAKGGIDRKAGADLRIHVVINLVVRLYYQT